MKDISKLLRQQKDDCEVLNALILLLDATIEREDTNVRIFQSKPGEEISRGLCNTSDKQGNKSVLG